MKRILLLCFLLASQNIFAQSGWTKIFNAGGSLNSIHFTNEYTGVICGTNRILMKTTNEGLNWIQLNTGLTGGISDAIMLSSQIILAASDNNEKIIRSTDGGVNWTEMISGSLTYRISNFSFPNDSIGYAVTDGISSSTLTKLYKTTNRGLTWSSSQVLCCGKWVEFINSQTGWVCGTSNAIGLSLHIKKTTNGAVSWEPGYYISMPGEVNNKIFIKNLSEIFWSWVDQSKVMKSYNSVVDWTSVIIPSSPQINSIKFINTATGWAAGSQGTIAKTTDGGSSWTSHSNGTFSFNKIFFLNGSSGWLVSSAGDVFRTTNGGLTMVNSIIGGAPEKYSLSQNYPNPFNPSTTINYSLPASDFVTLKVYDALGNEVRTLVSGKQNAGNYSLNFTAASLPSGIYFYKLLTTNFSEVRKMTLVK